MENKTKKKLVVQYVVTLRKAYVVNIITLVRLKFILFEYQQLNGIELNCSS